MSATAKFLNRLPSRTLRSTFCVETKIYSKPVALLVEALQLRVIMVAELRCERKDGGFSLSDATKKRSKKRK